MERLLEKNGFSEKDILPFEEVRLLADIKEPRYNENKIKSLIEQAEEALKRPVLAIPISHYVGYHNGTLPEAIPYFTERRADAIALAIAEAYEKKRQIYL